MSKENLINKINSLPDSPIKVSGKINSSDIKDILKENANGYSENDLTDELKDKLENNTLTLDGDQTITGVKSIIGAGELLSLGNPILNGQDGWISLGNEGQYSWKIKYVGSTSGHGGNEFRIESDSTGKYYQMDHDGNMEYFDGTTLHKIWNGANDGSGSGLDADTVDGIEAENLIQNTGLKTHGQDGNVAEGSLEKGHITTGPNFSGSVNYPTIYGQTWTFQGETGHRTFSLHRKASGKELYVKYWENDLSSSGWMKLLHPEDLDAALATKKDIPDHKNINLPIGTSGWYTIATCSNGRAIGRFGVKDTMSGRHQTCVFYASHLFGDGNSINIIANALRYYNPIEHIRIKDKTSADGAALQIYINTDDRPCTLDTYLLDDNFQSRGWKLIDVTEDSNVPEGISAAEWTGYHVSAGDIDLLIGNGSLNTSGDVYAQNHKLVSEPELNTQLFDKVDKESGKGLSTNDYNDADKAKLDSINVGRLISGDRDSGITYISDDVFNVDKSGFYYASSSALNKPTNTNGYFIVEALSNDYRKITYANHIGDGVFTNYRNAGVWQGWQKNEVLTPDLKQKLDDLPQHIVSSDSNGNIGIGIENPTVKLDIGSLGSHDGIHLGNFLKIRNSSVGSDAFVMEQIKPTGNLYVRSQSLQQYSGNLILNDIGGNVGVGTTSPQDKLHVNGGKLRVQTPTGYATFGSDNTSFFHFTTDRQLFYFGTSTTINGDIKLYNTDTYLRKSDGAIIQNGEQVATENQLDLKVDKLGLVSSSGRAYTPVNTSGWFKLASINRGAGIINVSFIGGDHQPVTFRIKYFKDWSSTGYLALERYGTADYLQEVRIIQDTDDIYYLEVLCKTHTKGLKMDVYDQPILGLNSTDVFTGNLQPGASGGTPIAHAYFVHGLSLEGNQHIAGNLGVGEHKPSEKLEVFDSINKPGVISLKSHRNDSDFVDVGQIVAKQDSTEVARINMTRAGGTYTGFMSFWTKENNSAPLVESMRINEFGKVGIGTTDPKEDLTIYNNSARLAVTGQSGSSAILLGNQDSMGVNTPAVIQGANGHLYLGKGTSWNRGGALTSTLQVNSNGKVGIGTGTDTPQQKLHVKGGKARFETEYGYVDLGAENNNWYHIKTDQQKFYLNKEIQIDGDIKVYGTNTYLRKSDGAIFENNSRVATQSYVDQSQQNLRGDIENNIDRDRITQMVIDSSRDELQVISNSGQVIVSMPLEDLRRELLK